MSNTPPKAAKKPTTLEKHGDLRLDNYYWLNERDNQDVINYLEAENAYYNKMTAHTKEFQSALFQEMKSRIKEDDTSVPYKLNGYFYLTRYQLGKEYPIHARKRGALKAKEEILFNCNEMAEGHDFFNLKGISVSPDNTMAAFGVDTVSRRQYTIRIKNLKTGEIQSDVIENTTGSGVWAADNKTLFYTKKDPITLRADRIFKHKLGTSSEKDELVFHEQDETYNTFIYKTKSKKFLVIGSFSTLTSEFRFLPTDEPDGKFRVFSERTNGLEWSHRHEYPG